MAVAPVDDAELAGHVDIVDGDELDAAGAHVIIGEALADERYAKVRADKAFDHGDAGQFHHYAEIGGVGAKDLVERLASEPGFGKDQRLLGEILHGDRLLL